jgi:nicotinamidase-related amidase
MGKTALVVLDLQVGIIERVGAATEYLSRVSKALEAARAASIPIIYVSTFFRHGHPDVSKQNAMFKTIASFGGFIEGDTSVAIHSDVAPHDGDVLVTKRRVSAFSGSDMDVVLRGLEVDHLILAGIATSGAILSTMREAADLDFQLTVISDLCLDPDEEVHRVLVEKVFVRQGRILKSEDWISEIAS